MDKPIDFTIKCPNCDCTFDVKNIKTAILQRITSKIQEILDKI